MIEQPTAKSYDEIPYPSLTYAQTQPDRLATMATLLGLDSPAVESCRYLDIGCAVGGNIIPMAYALPQAQFVGIDYSSRQIATGRDYIAKLGLKNIRLEQIDIMDFPEDLGKFDYIVAHGVYSWVPSPVRDRLLSIIRRHLAPNGVAYVSYNVFPGWHMLNIVRDMMRYHIRDVAEPKKRAQGAREMLQFLTEAAPADSSAFGSFLDTYSHSLSSKLAEGDDGGDALLLHDELEEINEPVYFFQFAEHAKLHGLQYLSEVELSKVLPSRFSPEIVKRLQELARQPVDMEQYLDFIRNRTFRQTLLCHQEVAVNRTLKPDLIPLFQLDSRARPLSESPDIQEISLEKFSGPDGAIFSTDHPLTKAALAYLSANSPRPIPFSELRDTSLDMVNSRPGVDQEAEVWTLCANLLRAHSYSSNLVELHRYLPPFVLEPGRRPEASAIARWQAERGLKVTNLRHERVELTQMARVILIRLDGRNRRSDLLLGLLDLHNDGMLVLSEKSQSGGGDEELRDILTKEVEDNLRFLGRAALLKA